MILVVNSENRHLHLNKIEQYFRIRKQIFFDKLKWDVEIDGDLEYDKYDFMPNHYILSLDNAGTVLGGLRQMRTTHPTLTFEKFADLIADPASVFGPDTWETTRFAIRPEDRDIRFASGVNRVAIELCAASLQAGLESGVRRHIAVCEERVIRLTKAFAIPSDTLGRRSSPEGGDILCVAWQVSEESLGRLDWARKQLAVA